MKSIQPETRRRMAFAWTISLMMLSITCIPIAFRDHEFILTLIGTLVVFPLLMAALPFSVLHFGKDRAERAALERTRGVEAYRSSPESHLLHLND